jgi:hypothetical protein
MLKFVKKANDSSKLDTLPLSGDKVTDVPEVNPLQEFGFLA